jgi:uncharacterized membrane protein
LSVVNTHEASSNPDNRSLLIGAACVALATLTPVALYQIHLIPKLPDPPFRVFDSETITMSRAAHPFGVPDALLGLASFGATLGLAIVAGRGGMARKLLGAKLGLDASIAAFNAGRQVAEFGKLCSWCTATALSAGVMAYAGRGSIREAASEVTNIAGLSGSREAAKRSG